MGVIPAIRHPFPCISREIAEPHRVFPEASNRGREGVAVSAREEIRRSQLLLMGVRSATLAKVQAVPISFPHGGRAVPPALSAYSNSASIGSRKFRFKPVDSHLMNASASFQRTQTKSSDQVAVRSRLEPATPLRCQFDLEGGRQ